MSQVYLFVLIAAVVGYTQVQCLPVEVQISPAAATVVSPEEQALKFQEMALSIISLRLLKADLPEDLMARAMQVAADTESNLDGCKTTLETNHIIWQHRVCTIIHMKNANTAIKALETEAANRLLPTEASIV